MTEDIALKVGDEISIETSSGGGIKITVKDNDLLRIVAKFQPEDKKPSPLSVVPD